MKKLFVCLFVAFVFIKAGLGQGHVFRKYTTNDDLPSSETYCVVQDKLGYMWIATDRGLVKFDGYNFKVFTTSNGMPDNTVFEVFLDDSNRVWFKTVSSELGYIKNDSVYTSHNSSLIKSLLPSQILRHVMFTDDGHIWFTHEENITGRIKFFDIDRNGRIDTSKNITDNNVKRIYVNRRGEKVGTGNMMANHVEIYLQETNKLLGTYTTTTPCRFFFVTPSKKKNGFFIFVNNIVLHVNNGTCTKIYEQGKNEILSLFADRDDNVWIGLRYVGFTRLGAKEGYSNNLTELNNHSISSITQDAEGGFWFTTLENGVFYLPPSQLFSYTEEYGLPLGKTNRIEKIKDNIVLVLADNSVLSKKPGNKYFTKIYDKSANYVDVRCNNTNYIYTIRTNDNISRFFAGTKHVPLGLAKKIHIGYKNLWAINTEELIKYKLDGQPVKKISVKNIPQPMCMYENSTGSLLIGTVGGLYIYENDTVRRFLNNGKLSECRISDIKFFNNNLLITSIGKGFFIIKGGDFEHPVHYTTDDGLPSIMCNVVLGDEDSVIWVGTNRGLCRIINGDKKERATFLTININDGIASNEVNDLCIIDDELWLATVKGITMIPRHATDDQLPDIPMYIERVTVNGEAINTAGTDMLRNNKNNISIFFTGIHYRNAGKLRYKYRMKGDTNWYYTTNRSVVFNGLPPGDYTFEVGVIKPNGHSNPKWAKYSFSILPPFWQTWWFVLLATLLAIGLLVAVVYKIILIKKDEFYKKAQLDRKLAQLELEAIKAQINPHFIYNCLNSIQYFNYKSDYTSVKKYFSMLALLIRQTMQFSHETFITLNEEVNYLTNYLELEKIRFKEKLNYHLTVETGLAGTTLLPAMLIQPYIENALKHGISNLESNGLVIVNFTLASAGGVLVVIEDNGPGLNADSIDGIHFGSRLTEGRVASYNQLFGLNLKVAVLTKQIGQGLRIELVIPPVTTESISRKKS